MHCRHFGEYDMSLVITGVYDGPLTGGVPKGIELYVTADIADLSVYGVGAANNGGGTDGEIYFSSRRGCSRHLPLRC